MLRALVACLACVMAMLFASPAYAADGGYSIDELSTEITVETNGAAHIVERQTVTFDTHNNGVVWYLHVPEDGESVRISSVRAAPVDDGGTQLGDWVRLQMIDSNPRLQGSGPGDTAAPSLRFAKVQPWYSYNIGDGMVRCYFPTGRQASQLQASPSASGSSQGATEEAEDFHTYVIETDYTVAHRVRVYRDVAELYWRYVNDSLPADAKNVNLQVKLPVPPDMEPDAVRTSIRAWGHGPTEGTFTVGDDGTVTYHLDYIAKGSYAEAHIIFPASWMTDMAPNAANRFSSLRGPSAIAEEAEWVDIAQREMAWDNNVRALFLGIAGVVILIGLVSALRHGRSPLMRRALMRTAATLAIIALGESLFFREPLTTLVLLALALVIAAVGYAISRLSDAGEESQDAEMQAGEATETTP